MTTITRSIEIDAGHRVPGHLGKCRNIHGHRYKIEVTMSGEVQDQGASEGMVMDFGCLKEAMVEVIEKRCDHTLILSITDDDLLTALGWNGVVTSGASGAGQWLLANSSCGWGTLYIVPFIPTAENLAEHWCKELLLWIAKQSCFRGTIVNVRVYETPNCWADYPGNTSTVVLS